MYLTQGLHRALQQQPDAEAICFGSRRRTFRELGERVARLAGVLQGLGLEAGDRVAILALNSDRYLECQLAVPWAGGVLNPCNTRWSPAEVLYSLNDARVKLLVIDDAFAPLVEPMRRGVPTLGEVIYAGEGGSPPDTQGYEALLAAAAPVKDSPRGGGELAGIFYTGGTTGFPKGVMLSHDNLMSAALIALSEGMTAAGAVCLHAAPMFHLADFIQSQVAWLNGSRHCVIPAFQPEAVLACIAREHVADTLLVPTMMQMLVDHPAIQSGHDLSSLKRVLYGGSPISEALLHRLTTAFPGAFLRQGYGMTENAGIATVMPPWYHTTEGRKTGKLRSAGRATYGTEIRVVDAAGADVPAGTVGEVVMRGPNVMLGYWEKPAETAAALRDGWLYTGDGAYLDPDGYLFIVDRLKDMIISGGENVYSAEVENALARHAAVATAAVIGVPDDRWGERVHAVIVCKSGVRVTAEELIAHCKQRIAGYKCPRSVEFREALPLSGAGKVQKGGLRDPYWKGRTCQRS